jgi:hypothetical protein
MHNVSNSIKPIVIEHVGDRLTRASHSSRRVSECEFAARTPQPL